MDEIDYSYHFNLWVLYVKNQNTEIEHQASLLQIYKQQEIVENVQKQQSRSKFQQ